MDLMFYIASQGDYADKAIAWATWGRYSHVEIRFSDGMCFSSSGRDGGVRFKQINIAPANWDIVHLSVLPVQEEAVIRAWCQTQVGKLYDWKGILCFFFPGDIQNNNKWYCSEICAAALREQSIMWFPRKISPIQMYNMATK